MSFTGLERYVMVTPFATDGMRLRAVNPFENGRNVSEMRERNSIALVA